MGARARRRRRGGRPGAGARRGVRRLADSLLRAGREGREPGAAERRRLLAAGGGAAFLAAAVLAGPAAGLAAAAAGPVVVARVLRAGRERYRAAVDAGAPAMAGALADALAGGHSIRGAVAAAAPGLHGAAGRELRRTAAELALGARTDDALEAMRRRARSHGVDTIVAAALLQRASGGDLARLLRDCARSLEDEARVEADARAATAQARFTGLMVALLPLGGALLAELASPGFAAGLASSLVTAWLAGLALALQAAAAVLIRRLGRVRA
ncbi:MAG TPA: type II secretion system F family protein [Thermoleophilaceae bacterium]